MKRNVLLAAIIGGLVFAGGAARAVSDTLVISEVYGGGGNTGAPFANDYIELRNVGTTPVALGGWSVQYASATGGAWAVAVLPDVTVPPSRYFLIQQGSGGPNGSPLPTPDAVGTINLGAAAGKAALVASAAALSGVCPAGAVDFVGYGTANCFEGAGPAPAPSNTLSAQRRTLGFAETDDNAADFEALTPGPQNSSSQPSAVSLRSLTVTHRRGAAVLRWRTGTEIDLLGFDLFRSRARARVKLNPRFIAARGGTSGNVYTYSTPPRPRWRFMLRIVERDGAISWLKFPQTR